MSVNPNDRWYKTYPEGVEVITSVERGRRWSVEEKLGIVAESYG